MTNPVWVRMCLFLLSIGCVLLPVRADRAHAATYAGGWDLSRGEIISWDNPDNVATSTDTSHPVTDGPYGMITEIAMARAGYYDSLGPYAHTLAVDGLGRSVLAVIERGAMSPGSGPVLFMSDLNAIEEELLLTTMNGPAMLNGVHFLLVPEPTTALLLVTGLAGLAAAGQRRSLH